ncbi:2'-5' RNA ligase family protein [Mucilaginibacter litoreus]|uniref:2'-5' RNA ligase family protein n=1 Tax=Mucilaginibacter litoreus TaxID=1048221 RepID=A0ABW3AMN9_9SPHI
MQTKQKPLILTLRLDAQSQIFFDELRRRYFPPERNYLKAHLTLFHQLPNEATTRQCLNEVCQQPFEMEVTGLRHLGAGVAYELISAELLALHRNLSIRFQEVLTAQDRQGFKPHITVQNKVTVEASKALLDELSQRFQPFAVQATGLDLWEYQGGPWRHSDFYKFKIKRELDLPQM